MCDRSIPVSPGDCRVLSCAFGPFPFALAVVGCVRMRSVHSRASWWSSCSFGYLRSIPVRSTCRRVHSAACHPFPCALGVRGCARYIPERRGGLRLHSVAIRTFPCALGVVGFVRLRTVYSRAPWVMVVWVRSIHVHTVEVVWFVSVRLVNSHAPLGSSGWLVCVRPGRRRVRSVHSRVPLGSSGSFLCVPFIPLRHGGRLVCSCACGPFPCALGFDWFVRVRSVHYLSPWGS